MSEADDDLAKFSAEELETLASENSSIRFDKDQHRCYLGAERLPAVGSVLREAAKRFNPWAKDDFGPEAKARMDRGKSIHKSLELHELGSLQRMDDAIKPFIDGLDALKKHLGVTKWDGIEEWVANAQRRYWGIIDRFHESCGVLDIKTGSSRPSSYRLQVAGYCLLKRVKKGAVVFLPSDRPFDPAKDIEPVGENDFECFKMALKLLGRKER